VVPAGCRVATDLTYWEIDSHGVYGTLEYIMKSYNVPTILACGENDREVITQEGTPRFLTTLEALDDASTAEVVKGVGRRIVYRRSGQSPTMDPAGPMTAWKEEPCN